MSHYQVARWQIPHSRSWGVVLALVAASISGVSVFVNGYAVKGFDDATVFTTAKNAIATILLLVIVAGHRRSGRPAPPRLTRRQWGQLAVLGLIGGSVPFVLFFEGLARASSTQAGFIHKTLVVWVAALAVPVLRERLTLFHVTAVLLLVGGQVALAGDLTTLRFGGGELMILAATLFWAIEFVIAKRLLGSLPSATVGAGRLGFGLVLLLGLVAGTGRLGTMVSLAPGQWGWVVLTGGLLAAFVSTWYAALARALALDVTAVLVFGAVVTAGLAGALQGAPVLPNGAGLALILAGTCAVAVGVARQSRLGALS
ncbi:MAG TPA: DMT family transporter [Acidimicrobiia bacterium]|nr:DMT family transporter [Acidimicrobiia bacterium]